ncbi:phage shock protein operon transcriptional activator [Novosphingobium pentaromativorans]|uniref:Psp operon transcriptional activator n=1 Tax=Novosphingobium pentaromativorans US6-1 TaxID=1088721 RepID=G6EEI8_9SPHN|nr:phage shock protein operon transcriptional activator [Novosphingobium pentaromativorans]AIT79424.1 ATPase AAA [Novosphingobium pentaromativorans US6-1]EHJ60233.1 psp operon transcriptional activator [Novosphingobium pentaromativorans US6-1]
MDRDVQFIGQSTAFLDAVERASRAAAVSRPVLVIGERGTGKELIAQRLHRLSPRWDEALVTMNCAALPETLIEAELFGHEAGAFTGAVKARVGRFEEADRGTLFLDELGTLSMAAQERLLRAIEYGEIARIGSSRPSMVDVRIVAATNADLPRLAEEGRFRADLLDRLSFEVINLPPLRAREGDVFELADYYGRRMAAELEWQDWPGFSAAALDALDAHAWPGNVRELRNVVERAVYRWGLEDEPIAEIVFDPFESPWHRPALSPQPRNAEREDASAAQAASPATVPGHESVEDLRGAVDAYESGLVRSALERHRWNQRRAAAALGLTYDQIRHCIRKHRIMESE